MRLNLEAGDAYHYMCCQYFRALALLHLGEWGAGLSVARDGLRLAEKNAHPVGTRVFRHTLGWFYEQAFDFEEARALSESSVEQSRGGQSDLSFGLIRLGVAHLGLGDLDSASRCFHEVSSRLERGATMDWIWHMHLHHGLGEHWLARGDFPRARQAAARACKLAAQSGERTYLALGRRVLAEVALAQRDWERAEVELSRALSALEGHEAPLAEWRVYATAAHLHQRRRRRAVADRCRARSLRVLHRLAESLGDDGALRRHMLGHMPT